MSAKKFIGASAVAFIVLMTSGTALAQTGTSTGTSTGTTTPGTPNTGTGAAANMIALGSSGALALAGLAYLARRSSEKLPE
jgi:LPXTG-motif cell wall-anchored protein